jgi:hypothetical protein
MSDDILKRAHELSLKLKYEGDQVFYELQGEVLNQRAELSRLQAKILRIRRAWGKYDHDMRSGGKGAESEPALPKKAPLTSFFFV